MRELALARTVAGQQLTELLRVVHGRFLERVVPFRVFTVAVALGLTVVVALFSDWNNTTLYARWLGAPPTRCADPRGSCSTRRTASTGRSDTSLKSRTGWPLMRIVG